MLLEDAVDTFCKDFQRFGVDGLPVPGQKMIIEDVDEEAAGVAQVWVEALAAAADDWVIVGITIDAAVHADAPRDGGRIFVVQGAFDKIPHQVAKFQSRVGPGQKQVKKIVQVSYDFFCRLALQFYHAVVEQAVFLCRKIRFGQNRCVETNCGLTPT